MAIILQANYTASAQQESQSEAARVASAEWIASNVGGLQWKVWIFDTAEKLRGGIYLFDDITSARAWGDGELRERLTAGGATNISITYFEADDKLSDITRATIARTSLAA